MPILISEILIQLCNIATDSVTDLYELNESFPPDFILRICTCGQNSRRLEDRIIMLFLGSEALEH